MDRQVWYQQMLRKIAPVRGPLHRGLIRLSRPLMTRWEKCVLGFWRLAGLDVGAPANDPARLGLDIWYAKRFWKWQVDSHFGMSHFHTPDGRIIYYDIPGAKEE